MELGGKPLGGEEVIVQEDGAFGKGVSSLIKAQNSLTPSTTWAHKGVCDWEEGPHPVMLTFWTVSNKFLWFISQQSVAFLQQPEKIKTHKGEAIHNKMEKNTT